MFSFLFLPPSSYCLPAFLDTGHCTKDLRQQPHGLHHHPSRFLYGAEKVKSTVHLLSRQKVQSLHPLKHSETFKWTFSCTILHIPMCKKHTQACACECMCMHICIQTLTTNDIKYNVNPIPPLSMNSPQNVLKNIV